MGSGVSKALVLGWVQGRGVVELGRQEWARFFTSLGLDLPGPSAGQGQDSHLTGPLEGSDIMMQIQGPPSAWQREGTQ